MASLLRLFLVVATMAVLISNAEGCTFRTARISYPVLLRGGHFLNSFDHYLHGECHSSAPALTYIYSYHDNRREDRRFKMGCSRLRDAGRLKYARRCTWSRYSAYDAPVNFRCSSNSFLSGWKSHHHNGREDRRMSYRCCTAYGISLNHCFSTGYVNGFDHPVSYGANTRGGYLITGVESVHHNHYEDRRFGFHVCKATFH